MTLIEQCLLFFKQQKHTWAIKLYIPCLHFLPTRTYLFLSFFLYDSQLYFHDSGHNNGFQTFLSGLLLACLRYSLLPVCFFTTLHILKTAGLKTTQFGLICNPADWVAFLWFKITTLLG